MFLKIHRKAPVLELFFKNFIKKGTPTQVFSYEFCKKFKNIFLYRTPLVAFEDSYSYYCWFHQTKILFRVDICSRRNCFTQFICAIQLNDIHIINIKITLSFNTLPPRSIRFCLIRLEVLYEKSLTTIHKFR